MSKREFAIDNVGRPGDKRGIMTADGFQAIVMILGSGRFKVKYTIDSAFPFSEGREFKPEPGTYTLETDET